MNPALVAEIEREREYQKNKGFDGTFDDKNTCNDWVTYITQYASGAAFVPVGLEQRTKLFKALTIAVAALEAFDRNGGFPPRHYDPPK